VLKQTLPAHEIFVADDCSPEDISWVATEFPTVKVLRLPENREAAGARLYAMRAATGTHIATLDGDDFWYPEKLERQVAYAEKIGDPRGIYSHQQWVEEGHGGTVRPEDGPRPGEPATEYLYVRNGFLQSNTLLMERNLYIEISLVAEGVYAHDYEIVMRSDVLKCRIYFLKEVLSQWNCAPDPRRRSISSETTYDRDYLPAQARYFTPKAMAAFRGRWLAPRLIKQGQIRDALGFLAQAVRQGALSPKSALKILLCAIFPGLYKRAAVWAAFLRRKQDKV